MPGKGNENNYEVGKRYAQKAYEDILGDLIPSGDKKDASQKTSEAPILSTGEIQPTAAEAAIDAQTSIGGRKHGEKHTGSRERNPNQEPKVGETQTKRETNLSPEAPQTPEQTFVEIKPGDVWVRNTGEGGKSVTERITIKSMSDGIVIIHREKDGEASEPSAAEEIEDLKRELEAGKYDLAAETDPPHPIPSAPTLSPLSPEVTSPAPYPEAETWTPERLLKEIPEGEFILRNDKQTMRFYRRQGNDFFNRTGSTIPIDDILDKLKTGRWIILKMGGVSSPIPNPEQRQDLLKGRDPKDYTQILPGDVWVLRTAKGEVLDQLTVNMATPYKYGATFKTVVHASSTWEKEPKGNAEQKPGFFSGLEWEKGKFTLKLEREGYVLEKAGSLPVKQKEVRFIPDHEKEVNPYAQVKEGDIWQLRGEGGKLLSKIWVEAVYEHGKGKKKELYVELETEDGEGGFKDRKLPLETFRQELQDEEYILIKRGEGDIQKFVNDLDKETKKAIDTLGLPQKGQQVHYESSEGEIIVRYDARLDSYILTQLTGEEIGTYSEGNVRRLAELQEWKKVGGEQIEIPKEVPPEKTEPEFLITLPKEKEVFYYRSTNKNEFRVSRDPAAAGVYILMALDTGREWGVSEAELLETAKNEQWEQLGNITPIDLDPLSENSLEKARQAVVEARNDFVRVEEEQVGAVERLKRLFPFLRKQGEINSEVRECWEAYQNAIVALQSLEIEKLKSLNLSEKKLHQEIAAMIRAYDFQEAENVDDAKREIRLSEEKRPFLERLEKRWEQIDNSVIANWSQYPRWQKFFRATAKAGMVVGTGIESTLIGAGKVGETYNQLTRTKGGKYTMMAAGGLAVGTGVLFSGGTAAGVAAVFLAAKRAAAGAGTAITVEGVGGVGAKAWRERQSKKAAEKFIKGEGRNKKIDEIMLGLAEGENAVIPETSPQTFERLQNYLNSVNKEAYSKFIKRESGRGWRKMGAVLAGTLVGGGASTMSHWFTAEVHETPNVPRTAVQVPSSETSPQHAQDLGLPDEALSPEGAASAPTGDEVDTIPDMEEDKPQEPPSQGGRSVAPTESHSRSAAPITPVAHMESASGASVSKPESLLGERTVVRGDTVWKYSLEGGKVYGLQTGAEQNRFASLVRERLNEKLANLDPDVAKAAGFTPNKDGVFSADWIQADKKLDLGKVLSESELKELAEQAKLTASGELAQGGVPSLDMEKVVAANLPSGAASDVVIQETAKALQEAGMVETAAPPTPVSSESIPSQVTVQKMFEEKGFQIKGKVMEYVRTLPDGEQRALFREMQQAIRGLFDTPEVQYNDQYSFYQHKEFARVPVQKILDDQEALMSQAFYIHQDKSANPLHWTQMAKVHEFYAECLKKVGKATALPLRGENVGEYVLRMKALTHVMGQSPKGSIVV